MPGLFFDKKAVAATLQTPYCVYWAAFGRPFCIHLKIDRQKNTNANAYESSPGDPFLLLFHRQLR